MPLYEYQCAKCGHRFEKIQKFSDKLIKKCPECGGRVEQVISAPAVQFKGSGWYVTDYAKNSARAAASDGNKDSKNEDKSKAENAPTGESSSKESPGTSNSSKEGSRKESAKSGSPKKTEKHC